MQKNPALLNFLFLRKKVRKNCQKIPQNGHFCKKEAFFLCFFLIFSELVLKNELRFCLGCTKCIKMLLLSHNNQIFHKFFNFYLLRLQRRRQCWHGVPWSEPRPAKHSAAPAMKAVLINSECYRWVKISKCSINMYPKTP